MIAMQRKVAAWFVGLLASPAVSIVGFDQLGLTSASEPFRTSQQTNQALLGFGIAMGALFIYGAWRSRLPRRIVVKVISLGIRARRAGSSIVDDARADASR